jgi:hypothetical protein
MPRIRFMDASRNEWAKVASVIVASSAATALPAAHTQTQDRTQVWRSLSQTGVQTLDLDLGAVVAIPAVAVANVKLVGTGVLQLLHRGDVASPAAETLVATLPTQDRDTRVTFAWVGQSHRHWRLKWTNPTAANDYAEAGMVHLGGYLEPSINPVVPAQIPRVDPSVESVSVDGQVTFVRRTKFYSGRWQFQDVPEAHLDNFRAMFDALGVSGAFVQVLDDALAWTAHLARVSGALDVGFGRLSGRYTLGLGWQEVR